MNGENLYRPIGRVVEEHRRWARTDQRRIGFGYPVFDSATRGGAAPGDLVEVIARTGVGKTWFLLNIINNNRAQPCIFFSIEMAGHMIVQRLAAVTYRTPDAQIEKAVHERGYHEAMQGLEGTYPRLAIIDQPGVTLKQMDKAVTEVRQAWSLQDALVNPLLILIDYSELIGGVRSMDTLGQIERVMKDLKQKAREWKSVVVVLHQSKRVDDETRIPEIKDGRYGGEQSPDFILMLHRPAGDQDLTRFGVKLAKTRGGHTLPYEEMVMDPACGLIRSRQHIQAELALDSVEASREVREEVRV